MPKFKVTQNMGASLRNLRTKRNIKAIDIAKAIDKTGAYISKLESGALNTIEEKDLIQIIKYMSENEAEFNEAITLLLEDTTMEFSEEESINEEWKMNIDLFYRRIPIPAEYREFVISEINSIGITIKELVEHINSNYELYDNDDFPNDMLDKSAKNHWYFNNGRAYIVLSVSEKRISDVIYGEIKVSNYSTFMCILVSLFRLKNFSYEEAYKKAHDVLTSFKIQTISEKEKIMQTYDNKNVMHTILDQRENQDLPEADRQLLNILYEFTKEISSFAQLHNIDYANNKLSTMMDNLREDPILFMGFIGVNLSKLKDCDFQIKKDFVKSLQTLVEEYSVKEPPTKTEELI